MSYTLDVSDYDRNQTAWIELVRVLHNLKRTITARTRRLDPNLPDYRDQLREYAQVYRQADDVLEAAYLHMGDRYTASLPDWVIDAIDRPRWDDPA